MSTKLGSLTLDLIAKTAGFTAPIKDAEKQTQSSFNNMRKHVNNYGMAVVGAAAGVVTALAAMAVDTANQAAELEVFAFRANTTTQEFQKMAVGAAAFGVEGDKLSDMMKDFNEKLGELTAIGAGGGVDFFEKIAMKTEGSSEAAKKLILDMQKLSGPEALQMYVDKLEEAGVTQQQMSFYLESMASDMTDLYPLLANGGEGMKLYGDMAERAGIIMTDQTIESAKELKDQVYMLDLQMRGAKNQLMQAVIPAFVDIAEAFLGGSEQGLQFEEVADGVAKTLKGLASVAIGAVTAIQLTGKALGGMAAIGGAVWNEMDWYEMNPLGLAKAAYEARGEIAALTSEIKGDMHETVMTAADRLDKMWKGDASEKAKQLRGIRELTQGVGDTNSGLSELADKQNEVTKATKENNKAQQELNRSLEEQARARDSISYDYLDDFAKFAEDHKRQMAEIQKANFGPQESEYLAKAKARYEFEEEMYLRQITEEINDFKWSEEQKLNYFYETQRIIVNESGKYNDELKQLKLKALNEQNQEELSNLKLAQDQQLFQAQQSYMHEVDAMQERYRLEREEIEKIKDEKQRAGLLNASYRAEDDDYETKRRNAWNNYRQLNADRDGSSEFLQLDFAKEDASKTIEDSIKYNLITEKEGKDALLKIEEDYQKAKLQLSLTYGEKIAGSAADSMAMIFGEQSGAYKAMFAVQKGFAIAQSMIAIQQGIANAMSLPFPTNLAAAATVAVETASILSNIRSVTMAVSGSDSNISGMAHDGIDNIPKEGTWLLDKGERVVDSRTNGDLKNYLKNSSSSSNSGTTVNVNHDPSLAVTTRDDGNGNIDVYVRKIVEDSWNQLSRPNSKQSKLMGQNFNAPRRR